MTNRPEPVRVDTFRVALDNREPWHRSHRDYSGSISWYPVDAERIFRGVIPDALREIPNATDAIYLLDDGETVEPFYVVGWSPLDNEKSPDTRGDVMIGCFPVNVDSDGSPILRADDNRPVDYSSWQLGPKRAYHLKVTRGQDVRDAPPATLSPDELFFYDHAGYCYDPKTETPIEGKARMARNLANAESFARMVGWSITWSDDPDGTHSYADQPAFDGYQVSTCELATLVNGDGEVLQSLGCIDDADDDSRRVVAAELAAEEMTTRNASILLDTDTEGI